MLIFLIYISCLNAFEALHPALPPILYKNLTLNSTCPEPIAEHMNYTLETMGCCINLVLNTTSYRRRLALGNLTDKLLHDGYWEHCNIGPPGQCSCEYENVVLNTGCISRSTWTGLVSLFVLIICIQLL